MLYWKPDGHLVEQHGEALMQKFRHQDVQPSSEALLMAEFTDYIRIFGTFYLFCGLTLFIKFSKN